MGEVGVDRWVGGKVEEREDCFIAREGFDGGLRVLKGGWWNGRW